MMNQLERVMADTRSFMQSRVILTAAELDVFSLLHQTPSSVKDLAEKSSLDLRNTTRLLDCLVSLGLLEKESELYRTTETGALLSSHHPESVLPMVLHYNHLWDTWSYLTETIVEGNNPAKQPLSEKGGETLKAFIGAMHVIGRNLAGEIADAYDLSPFKSLLDIGGASGTYTMAFLRKNPSMRAVIFDRKDVLPLADERLRAEGFRERVDLVGGDFYRDELPGGSDLALLSAIIHQNSPEENVDLYRKAYRALAPGGVLLIRDHIMDETRTKPPGGAMFALNMLVNTRGGDTYTYEEVRSTLERAGFTDVKWVREGEHMDSLVEARKPG
jgi:SAM-dependent methyltransferase/predicted transcriptional regulator